MKNPLIFIIQVIVQPQSSQRKMQFIKLFSVLYILVRWIQQLGDFIIILQVVIKEMSFKRQQGQQSQIQQGQQVSQHSESSQFIKVKSAGRKNLCQICSNVLAKYTCPKCQLKTCSLNCTRKHKEVKQCTGEKDPTEYVSKNQIDQNTVHKDYNFIQDMISGADKVKKVLSGVNNTINLQPRRFKILRNNAKQLFNIKLSNGPNILQRHRQNISFFFVKSKSIYWVFQLLYFEGKTSIPSSVSLKTSPVITAPNSDQKTFLQILPQNYLNKELLQMKNINTTKRQQFFVYLQNKQRSESREGNDYELKRRQNAIISQNIKNGKFVTHFELIEYDMNKKICEQLVDVSIFQFPTLYVVHQSLRKQFLQAYKQIKLQKNSNDYKEQRSSRKGDQTRQRSRQKQYRNGRSKQSKPKQPIAQLSQQQE